MIWQIRLLWGTFQGVIDDGLIINMSKNIKHETSNIEIEALSLLETYG